MKDNDTTQELNCHWRGLEDGAPEPEFLQQLRDEFPQGAVEVESRKINRRKFLALMGASSALAGVGMVGCRKPTEYIMPYARRPEDIVPGNPLYFATSAYVAGKVMGLLVESQEGRPTKIEGNPCHPANNPGTTLSGASLNPEHLPAGKTDAWTQAQILDLYDASRSKHPLQAKKKVDWKTTWKSLDGLFSRSGRTALLLETLPSPTRCALLREISKRFSNVTTYIDDASQPVNAQQALANCGAAGFDQLLHPDRAQVLVALDSDFLGTEGDTVRNAMLFARGRVTDATRQQATMNRLYSVEAAFSTTGAMADNRLRMPSSQVGWFLLSLCARLGLTAASSAWTNWRKQLGRFGLNQSQITAWLNALVKDLSANRGKSLIVVGERQPAWVHKLALWANQHLGSIGNGKPLQLVRNVERPSGKSLGDLVAALRGKAVDTLVIIGGNPVYTAPRDYEFAALALKVKTSVHLSSTVNETSAITTWHLPQSHFLETWGDLRATDGTFSIQQPLIAPLFDTVSDLETLSRLSGRPMTAHALVTAQWIARSGLGAKFAKRWQKWLHDGVVDIRDTNVATQAVLSFNQLSAVVAALKNPAPQGLEVNFVIDRSVYDGRFANNAWLQELPDMVTKVAWDNVAMISPATAKKLGMGGRLWNIEDADAGGFKAELVNIKFRDRFLDIAAWITPGIADNTVVIPLGYHRTVGSLLFAERIGFNANLIRTSDASAFGWGASVSKMNERYRIASTQHHGTMLEPRTGKIRPVVRDHQLATYRSAGFPAEFSKPDVMPKSEVRSLWKYPESKGALKGSAEQGPQWGMVIDLAKCTGCNACTLACQAENNIPVVGKQEVGLGREMHWIRIDRYFTGDEKVDAKKLAAEIHSDPKLAIQPIACQHCENAPCENVCPVGATQHSPDGLNDMTYNRCIGTRYCMNNCPYKVRRFNFYNFTKRNDKTAPLIRLQRNPDVTVRFRGVVEKCTFCTQRIQRERIAAKVSPEGRFENGFWKPKDGSIVPACEQSCPSDAIVFGNINDKSSRVWAAKHSSPRNYELLADYNFKPRTSYLAKLRNPNPELKG